MTLCDRCGKEIDIRIVGGRAIPLHLNGGCIANSASWKHLNSFAASQGINDRPSISSQQGWSDDICHRTKCRKCGQAVLFVRHNGGSVWLDLPPGWPWPKHGCMYDEGSTEPELPAIFQLSISSALVGSGADRFGVVNQAAVYLRRKFTVLGIKMFDGTVRLIGLTGLHDDLLAEVIYLQRHFNRLRLITPDGLSISVTAEHVTNPFDAEDTA